LPGYRPATGIYPEVQDFAADFSRAGVERIDSRRHQV